jgi:L-lactate dehydrogenase complex protein LldG
VGLLDAVPGVSCKLPGGAFYAWPNVTEACRITGCADSEAFRKRLLAEAGVAVLADIHFGRRVPGDGQHIRFSYAASPDAIREGVARLDAFPADGVGVGALSERDDHGRSERENGMSIADNRAARDAVLGRVRKALGKEGDRSAARAAAEAYVAAKPQGPRPAMPADLAAQFIQRARDMASTVEELADRREVPHAVARYLDALELPPALAAQRSHAGVCWPEFADLDWAAAGLAIEARPTQGDDRLGITGAFCAIAETGTLVVLSGADTPTATTLLPDSWIAVIRRDRIVSGMEEAFARVRAERGGLPRAINMISGPSRTGDIEQTIVLGAHGPYRVHILVVG